MNNINTIPDFSNHRKAISNFLDELGKAIPEEFFHGINNYFVQSLKVAPEHHPHLLKNLGIGFSFVFDTNPIQEILRRELRNKNSDVFEGMRIGNIVALAPFNLDDEIAEHIPDIAKDCNKTPLEALKIYHDVVRPHIHFMSVENLAVLEKVRRDIRDADDAPFVVLFMEKKPLGIVTRDKDIREFDGTKCFDLKEVGQIHVDCRKRETALMIVFAFLLFLYGFAKLIWNFIKGIGAFIKRHPWLSLAFLLFSFFIVIYICYQENEKTKKYFLDKWQTLKTGIKKTFSYIGPYVAEFSMQVLMRISDTNIKTKELLETAPSESTPLRLKNDRIYEALSLEELIKHVLLAFRRPLKCKEISDSLKFLGVKAPDGKSLNGETRKTLNRKGMFSRDIDGLYFLSAHESTPRPNPRKSLLQQL